MVRINYCQLQSVVSPVINSSSTTSFKIVFIHEDKGKETIISLPGMTLKENSEWLLDFLTVIENTKIDVGGTIGISSISIGALFCRSELEGRSGDYCFMAFFRHRLCQIRCSDPHVEAVHYGLALRFSSFLQEKSH
ncbi:MAG: hypothetical protein LBT70_02660 [Holosporaceae bacterium]|nr:hypothetical protein [Holosporaceae bacterium]